MALSTAAAVSVASALSAMYLDAKLLIRHDLASGALSSATNAATKYTAQRVAEDRMTISDDLERHAKSPDGDTRLFLLFEGRTWTYRQFYTDIQRAGHWLMNDLGIQRDEIVALMAPNSPTYVLLWFALESIGAVPAFINCNLTSQPLMHCVKLVDSRYLLADAELRNLVEPLENDLESEAGSKAVFFEQGFVDSLENAAELPRSRRSGLPPTDLGLLMYTSGTTGLPKAIKITRGRGLNTSRNVSLYLSLKPGNIMYTCLPLYHGAAQGLCFTPCIHAGAAIALSRKFSHKTFWPEVRESKADTIQYVGELCRYLVNAPPDPLDKKHNVKMAWGNGMRPDVWDVLRDRFAIDTINELYAATDGIGISFNHNRGEFGKYAIGKRGAIWHLVNGKTQKRIKIDPVTQEIIRDENGFAIACQDGEAGEACQQMDPATEQAAFAGYYKNDDASEKRKVRNLFQKGDLWFRSGDLQRLDADGCLYFVDRLGDTYRWKSENVSTNEVADVMGAFDQIAEANVYGVLVPHADGRCGCAAVVLVDGLTEQQLDLERLAKHATKTLPRYAVPIFIRVVKAIQYTGNHKMQKGQLREEGIDLDRISAKTSDADSLYWLPPGQSRYVPFRRKEWEELKSGKTKL